MEEVDSCAGRLIGCIQMQFSAAFVVAVFVTFVADAAPLPPRPELLIETNGGIIWPAQSDAGYQLQVTPRLESPAWTNVGPPLNEWRGETTIGVTNLTRPTAQAFYRVIAFPCTNYCRPFGPPGPFSADIQARPGPEWPCTARPCHQVWNSFGFGNHFFSSLILEGFDCMAALRVKIELQSPPGINYDLYLYANDRNTLVAASERKAGELDTVLHTIPDNPSRDDSTVVWIEIRYVEGVGTGMYNFRLLAADCSE